MGLVARSPYLPLGYAVDDRYLQLQIGLVHTGQTSLVDYVGQSFSSHFSPLWRLIGYLEWRLFGLNPLPARLALELAHALTAVLVYLLLYRAGFTRWGAIGTALLWATVASGEGCDGLVEVSGLHFVGAVVGLLAALWFMPSLALPRPRLAWFGLLTALAIATLFWGYVLALAPVVLVVPWIADRNPPQAHKQLLARSAVVLAVVVVFALGVAFATAGAGPSLASGLNVGQIVTRAASQMAVALGNMFWWSSLEAVSSALGTCAAVAVVLLLLAVIALRGPVRGITLVFFAVALLYLAMVNVGRAGLGTDILLASARYQYLPKLAWCVVIGATASSLWTCSPAAARLPVAGLVSVLLCAMAAHNYQVARLTASRYHALWGEVDKSFAANRALLLELASQDSDDAQPLPLLNMPVRVPPVEKMLYPLAVFHAVCYPAGLPGVEVVNVDAFSSADEQRATAAMARSAHPLATDWERLLPRAAAARRELPRLLGYARHRGETFYMPPRVYQYGDLRVLLSQYLAYGLGRQFTEVRVTSDLANCEAERMMLAAELRATGATEGRAWAQFLESVSNSGVNARR